MASVEPGGAVDPRAFVRHSVRQWHAATRLVVAAVCYRMRPDHDIEFLLVRTRSGRWTFPKGGIDRDPTAAAAAAREAYEEAGVLGKVEQSAFTRYLHAKGDRAHTVNAYLCEVLQLEMPAEPHRTPTWFPAAKAKRRLSENRPAAYASELDRVVEHAIRRLAGRVPRQRHRP